jgi:hypothetical protein
VASSCITGAVCGSTKYCADVELSGQIELLQCLPYPSGCDTCGCATMNLRSYYVTNFPGMTLPICYCSDAQSNLDAGMPVIVIRCLSG